MELTPAQITEGMIFYGVKSGSDFPEFSKYEAIKATNKQVKAKKAKTSPWGKVIGSSLLTSYPPERCG